MSILKTIFGDESKPEAVRKVPVQVEMPETDPILSGQFVYTIEEAALILKISEDTIRRKIRTGVIETAPDVRPFRIPAREMRRLIGQPQPRI